MKIYSRKYRYKKGVESNIPNLLAFTFIRNFLTDKSYEEMKRDYFINDLNNNQVNKVMKDIKHLFKEYKGLDIITIENYDGSINKFIL